MNKVVKGLKAVYHGFMPVSQIKGTFIAIISLYLLFLAIDLKADFTMQRSLKLENRQQGGSILLNGVKHLVPYVATSTKVKFEVSNPLDFLLLSNGELNDSFLTAVLKIVTCILVLKFLWSFDFNDPFNMKHYKQVNLLGWLGMLILVADYARDAYTLHWFNNISHNSPDFKYSFPFNFFFFISGIWILKAITSCYQKGVKTQQEAELTI